MTDLRNIARLLCAWLAVCALAGCAAQKALEQGEKLIASGQTREGLAKLQEAVQLEPTSAQYRMAYMLNRDRAMQSLLDRADAARGQGRTDEAEALFREVLSFQAGQERALAGLRAIDNERRWSLQIAEAEALLARKDTDAAREKLRPVLVESPRHAQGRDLLQRIERAAERPVVETALAASFRKPISIEFKDTSLRTVFDIIARTAGLNFLFDKDVRSDQKTSIFLRNSTIEAAVNMLLLTNQLEQRIVDGSTVLIYPASANKLREYQPLTVRSFYLSHAEAKVVAATVKAIAKSRDVVVDDKLNLLIVRDSPAAIRMVEKLVALHDVPEPEVMLEVEILEVKRTRLLDLGVRLPDQLSLTPLAATSGGAITLRDLGNLNSGSLGAQLGATSINAKKQETDANLLANPRIRTRNREKAKILIGERVPNITTTLTSTGFSSDSVNYVDVGLKLDVEPVIYPDGEVSIRIALEVSNIIDKVQTKSGSLAFQIGTRGAQTVLRLADGENQVLAGLINDEDRRTAYKLPGAGDLPVIGRLFGSQADDNSKTEIVLSITPRIIRNIPRPAASLAEFDSGTEASVGQRFGGAAAPVAAAAPSSTAARPALPSAGQGAESPRPTVTTPEVQPSSPAPAATAPATLTWLAPRQIKVGDTVTLQVMARSDSPVADLPLTLTYDPSALQHMATNEGDFMRQGGAPSQFTSRPEPAGQVAVGLSKANGGASGSGVLVSFTFRALAAASPTTLALSGATASAPGGGSVPVQAPQPLALTIAP